MELAYLDHFLTAGDPLFGLVRTGFGYLLLDRNGCGAFAGLYHGQGVMPKAWAWMLLDPTRHAALHWVRRRAIARRRKIAGLLRKLPRPCIYWNVGHANLSADTLAGMAGIKSAVLIHDTIPLDHPQYCRPDQVAPFAHKIAATAQYADLVIHISKDARTKTEAHFAKRGRVPPGVTAHLGLNLGQVQTLPQTDPYFVALGTIEPRKNHALLFDIWERHQDGEIPPLHVIGAKGWADPDLFAQMDRLIARNLVIHHPNLSDPAAMCLLAGAQALLFPSLAEGFGLPPLEAAALGVPVIASDLPVLREVLGDLAVYLDVTDRYSWQDAIAAFRRNGGATQNHFRPPTWSQHFKTVLTAIE